MRKLTEHDKAAAIAAHLGGESVTSIARRFQMSRGHMSIVINEFRRDRRAKGEDGEMEDLRKRLSRLEVKSVTALEAGLDATNEDPLRAGALGLGALKEMGTLTEVANAEKGLRSFIEQIHHLPEDWKATYFSGTGETPKMRTVVINGEEYEVLAEVLDQRDE